MISSVAVSVFAVSAIAFFIIGVLCRNLCKKQGKFPEAVSPSTNYVTPLHDDIHLPKWSEQEIGLSTNVAYDPVNIPHQQSHQN